MKVGRTLVKWMDSAEKEDHKRSGINLLAPEFYI